MRLFLLLTVVLNTALNAQTIFAPVGATWVYSIYDYWDDNNYESTAIAIGDTSINGRPCRTIQTESFDCNPLMPYMNRLFTYTSGDSVFWYDQVSGSFRLLVPFNIGVGGSWQIPLDNDTVVVTVNAVDTANFNGVDLRRLHVSQATIHMAYMVEPDAIWTERFGNSLYLVPWRYDCSDADVPIEHVCYSDSALSWPNNSVSCAIWMAQVEVSSAPRLSITPSIAQRDQTVLLQIDRNTGPQVNFNVIDALGRLVFSNHLEGIRATLQFSVSGTYFVVLTENGRQIVHQRVLIE